MDHFLFPSLFEVKWIMGSRKERRCEIRETDDTTDVAGE